MKYFKKIPSNEQDLLIWERSCKILKEAAEEIKNKDLLNAVEKAEKRGIEIGLNPNFRIIEKKVILFDLPFKASVWICFTKDKMNSKFTLEKENKIIYSYDIDNTIIGNGFFLDIYKVIELSDNKIIIKGHKEIEYLPLTIPIQLDDLELTNEKDT